MRLVRTAQGFFFLDWKASAQRQEYVTADDFSAKRLSTKRRRQSSCEGEAVGFFLQAVGFFLPRSFCV